MPKNKAAAKRHRIIDNCLNSQRHQFPTKAYLAKRCSEILDMDVSESTIEKDIAEMKRPYPAGYDAPIVYSKIEKGYIYGEKGFSIAELTLQDSEWEGLSFAAQLLYQYKDVPVFANFKAAIERINTRFSLGFVTDEKLIDKRIHFEQAIATKGLQWIHTICEALENNYAIEFSYNNIYKKQTKAYTLIPYLLKEHRNRWYVIGWSEERANYLTFALDRIADLSVNQSVHKRRNDFNATQFFEYATGIMEGAEKPTQIELTIQHPLSELVLLEPIHQSQQLISNKNNQIKIGLNVFVNEELYLKILSMGVHCTVNKPASLKKKIKEMIDVMAKNYA